MTINRVIPAHVRAIPVLSRNRFEMTIAGSNNGHPVTQGKIFFSFANKNNTERTQAARKGLSIGGRHAHHDQIGATFGPNEDNIDNNAEVPPVDAPLAL